MSEIGIYRDRVLGELIGLAKACETNPKTANTDGVVIDTLAACAADELSDVRAAELIDAVRREKDAVAPSCAVCQSPCGHNDAYDLSQVDGAESGEVRRSLLNDACAVAASLKSGALSDGKPSAALDLFYRLLPMVGYELSTDSYSALKAEIGGIKA